MSITEDLNIYVDTDVFGQAVTVAGSSVNGILGTAAGEDMGVMGYRPQLTCRTEDVSTATVGAAVVAAGLNFTILEIWEENQEGTGMTRFILKEDDPQATATWSEVADFTLGAANDIPYVLDLAIQIALVADLNNNISFGNYDDRNSWRALLQEDWIPEVVAAHAVNGGLTPFSLTEITTSGLDIVHDIGIGTAGFTTQIDNIRTYLEGLIGARVETVAYPLHRHDEITMQYLQDKGFLAARDGIPQGYDGIASNLLGKYDQEDNSKTWEKLLPFSMQIPQFFSSSHLDNMASKSAMYDFLYDTANNQSNPVSTLFGSYTNLMEQWKANNTFVPYFQHDELSADQVQWLMEIMTEDSDVWVGTFGEIMRWAKMRHKPTTAEAFIWEPRTGFTASDLDNAPWNGKKMAFAFSSDDGELVCYTEILSICQTLGVGFTCFCMEEGAQHGLSEAQIIALHDSGSCEIALHGTLPLIREEACKLTHAGTATRIACEIVDEAGTLHMKFYKDVA